MPKKYSIIDIGQAFPIGATILQKGVNFCIYSKSATRVELLLFEHTESDTPYETIVLNKEQQRTGFYWHVLIKGLKSGQVYAYRVHGPSSPSMGHRFDPQQVGYLTQGISAGSGHCTRR
jgi:glycogen operon protein